MRARSVLAGRGFVLFPAAAYAVHQLRYGLGYGSAASSALAAQGHGYLDSLAPWIALLLALGFGSFLMRLARAAAGRADSRARRSTAGLIGVAWALLFATYAVQEWLEGMFAAGHPAGLAGIVGHGGWWALPLSGVAAVAVTGLLRLASAAVEAVSSLAAARVLVPACVVLRPAEATPLAASPLAGRLAGRSPPEAFSAACA